MKLILAIIRPESLAAVQAALPKGIVHMITVSQVLDCAEQGPTQIYRGRQCRRPSSKLRLEVAVDDSAFDAAVEAIERAGDTGQVGGGKTFVLGLDECDRPGFCEETESSEDSDIEEPLLCRC